MKWEPAKTAPRDGTAIIANFSNYPWALSATYCKASKSWCAAELQVEMFHGKWNDSYFENEWVEDNSLLAWMPMPKVK